MSLKRWPKKVSFIIILIVVLVFLVKLYNTSLFEKFLKTLKYGQTGSHNTDDKSNVGEKSLKSWVPNFSYLHSCPLCFGYEMCDKINRGSILFHGEMSVLRNNRIVWKKGVLQADRVLISSVISDEWNKFDEFVCRNASQSVPCDLLTSVSRSVLVKTDLLSLQNFRNLNALLDIPHTQFALSVCSSGKFLSTLKQIFDINYDNQLNEEEKILLLTSIIMQPSYVILKLQSRAKMNLPFPNLLGACGRSVILEGGLTPLKDYLSEPFDTRAVLAAQVLQLVEKFKDEDPQWYFLYTGFSLDSIVVNKNGELVVIDLDDLVVLDKLSFSGLQENHSEGLCNEVCFQKVTLEMFYGGRNSSSCSYISEYGQLMYAVVCKQVLSNLGEHKFEGFFNFDGHRIHKKIENPGLLHSLPYKIKENVEDLLRECVQETTLNGRKIAVDKLKDILKGYANVKFFVKRNSFYK